MYKQTLLTILLIFSLVLAACGGDDPTPEPVIAPTDTPAPPTPTPVPATPTPVTAVDIEDDEVVREPSRFFEALQTLNSYRVRMAWKWEPDEGIDEEPASWEMIFEVVNTDPIRERVIMMGDSLAEADEFAEEEDQLEMIRIGNKQYTKMGAMGWIETPVDDEERFSAGFADPAFFVADVENLRRGGSDVIINGILSRHYVFSTSDMIAGLEDELTELEGDLYVAVDGGFVTRYEIRGRSQEPAFGLGFEDEEAELITGRFTVRYDLEAVNQEIVIEAPEDASLFEFPGVDTEASIDLPLPEDAEIGFSMGTMIQFSTQMTMDEVIEFYTEALEGLGWTTEGDELLAGEMAMLNFSQDDQRLSLMIQPDEEREGYTSVFITRQ